MPLKITAALFAATAAVAAPTAWAQNAAPSAPTGVSEADAPDLPPVQTIEDRGEMRVDPATIAVPDINFVETPEHAENFDKYFFFHREGTDFETALADIRECDDYARGLAFHVSYSNPYYYGQNGMAGALGYAIGTAVADAIIGSARLRRLRWQNLRICMGYKEYQRFGLPKRTWEMFNFSEGFSSISERRRQVFLQQQAKIASGPRPSGRVLEP